MFVKDLRIAGNNEFHVLGYRNKSIILEALPTVIFLSWLHLWYCMQFARVPPFPADEDKVEKIQGKVRK